MRHSAGYQSLMSDMIGSMVGCRLTQTVELIGTAILALAIHRQLIPISMYSIEWCAGTGRSLLWRCSDIATRVAAERSQCPSRRSSTGALSAAAPGGEIFVPLDYVLGTREVR